jgi:hypothetical protein
MMALRDSANGNPAAPKGSALAQKIAFDVFLGKIFTRKRLMEASEPLASSEHNALSQRMSKQQETKEDARY